jgi:hypothetical protein
MKYGKIISVVRERQQKAYQKQMERLRNEWERQLMNETFAGFALFQAPQVDEKRKRWWWPL